MRRRISHQLILAAALISVAIFSLLWHFLSVSHQRSAIAIMSGYADEFAETIRSSTRYAMLQNRGDEVHQIIDSIGQQEGILKIRVFNKAGKIIYSPDKEAIGTLVDKRAEACYGCHTAGEPLERLEAPSRVRMFTGVEGQRTLGVVKPIYNEPSCSQAACHAHPATQTVLGVLDVTLSLAGVDRHIAADRSMTIAVTAIAVVLIGGIIWLLFHQLVGKPVQRLVKATDAVAGGNLDFRLEVRRNDELGRLARSFNEMTRQLVETQTQLYESNRLASVGRLAAGIAHEINNPLTGVLTFSSLLLRRDDNDAEVREDLETIVAETKRCRGIVKGLLDFSRQVPPRKVNVDFNHIVDQALGIVDHQLNVSNIEVTKSLSESLPPVRADPNQMMQVLINLLVNAADAIGERSGEIFVGTELTIRDEIRSVKVKVADDGCGIEEENLDKVFEPFFSTKKRGGTGLGLAVVWGIIHEHDGTIAVASQPGRGTTFTILFPVGDGPGVVEEAAR